MQTRQDILLLTNDNLVTEVIEETYPVLKAIKKYKNHPVILRVKSSFKYPKVFLFKYFNVEDVKREMSPVYKKKDRHDKSNYRPVSILPLLSKPFERILYEQRGNCSKDILSKYQGGFRKKFNTQHSLLAMFEKWKIVLDNGGNCGALDCIVHDLLLAKLSAYVLIIIH